ncbi:MAG: potassium channel protein [Thermodesulfobacteriota bacterium]
MSVESRRLLISALVGLVIIAVGTAGYVFLERWNPLDALYMTVITLSTIGFGEVHPLSPAGRTFTLLLVVFGVGNAAYLVGQFTRLLVEGSLRQVLGRRKLEAQIKKLQGHYLVCGYGRIGRLVAQEISARKLPVVVIEKDPEALEQLEKDGRLYVKGEASDEDCLLAAGITSAVGLISAVSSDADNLYVVITARDLNPDLFILTRASEERSFKKLLGAGADQVISPYLLGARKMAQTILRPAVSDFIETMVHNAAGLNLAMEEILVTPDSSLKDITLLESNIRRDLDLIVIAIKTAEGRMLFNPSAQALIQVGDTLIAMGQRDNMDRLARILGADTVTTPRYHGLRARTRACRVDPATKEQPGRSNGT